VLVKRRKTLIMEAAMNLIFVVIVMLFISAILEGGSK
jgi:hypothetical protein